jgi:hypothetical protein
VWACHADVPATIAEQLDTLARDEPAPDDLRREPLHTAAYRALLPGSVEFGPAFMVPPAARPPAGVILIDRLEQLEHLFGGWTAAELPERQPIVAVPRDGQAVSVCFCARRSTAAAEAGVETAPQFRGRGLAAQAAAAWAWAIHASGRLPIYSTSWDNTSSLAVARKLGLTACASDWSLLR